MSGSNKADYLSISQMLSNTFLPKNLKRVIKFAWIKHEDR